MIRTEDVLRGAMLALMQTRSLEEILVKDICQEACIGRSVFYAYFRDKYDLLSHCQGFFST